jgi:hypothetical protein
MRAEGRTDMDAPRRRGTALAAALALALAAGACAAQRRVEAQRSEELLAAAGFRQVQADTPEREAALRRLQPDTVTEVMRDGRTFYVYPDPDDCHCLYVGGGDQHEEYQKLVYQSGHPQPRPLPWNEAELGEGWMGWGTWGAWPWFD